MDHLLTPNIEAKRNRIAKKALTPIRESSITKSVPTNETPFSDDSLDVGAAAGSVRGRADGLLGGGELKAKVALAVFGASKSAVAAVEKAGGTVQILAPKEPAGEQAA